MFEGSDHKERPNKEQRNDMPDKVGFYYHSSCDQSSCLNVCNNLNLLLPNDVQLKCNHTAVIKVYKTKICFDRYVSWCKPVLKTHFFSNTFGSKFDTVMVKTCHIFMTTVVTHRVSK